MQQLSDSFSQPGGIVKGPQSIIQLAVQKFRIEVGGRDELYWASS